MMGIVMYDKAELTFLASRDEVRIAGVSSLDDDAK